jgi:mRNA-degrading endonuclease RelE of RelBE toxin-antitoxin system
VKIFFEIDYLPEFEKDFKRLSKKFRTLEEDFKTFINTQLNLFHKKGIDNKGVVPISGIGIPYPKVYKARKFACRSLKGRGVDSGIRVIYTYWEEKDKLEFIEIYFKGDKENEDRDRILVHYNR